MNIMDYVKNLYYIYMKQQRKLFTDGWNSFWHVFFGVIAVRFSIAIPIFIAYQLIDYKDVNLMVDIIEFFIGFIVSRMIVYVLQIRI